MCSRRNTFVKIPFLEELCFDPVLLCASPTKKISCHSVVWATGAPGHFLRFSKSGSPFSNFFCEMHAKSSPKLCLKGCVADLAFWIAFLARIPREFRGIPRNSARIPRNSAETRFHTKPFEEKTPLKGPTNSKKSPKTRVGLRVFCPEFRGIPRRFGGGEAQSAQRHEFVCFWHFPRFSPLFSLADQLSFSGRVKFWKLAKMQ